MDRIFLIQHLIKKYNFSTYLEIGTQEGLSFFPIICKRKIAVDPYFKLGLKEKFFHNLNNKFLTKSKYFETTSDDFFKKEGSFLKKIGGIDIVLVDGLHTFEATLNDILNSLKFINRNGIIIVHDSFPPHKAAAVPAENSDEARDKGKGLAGWTGEWCGDTWKAIAYMKLKYGSNLNVKVLDFDYGLGVIQRNSDKELNLAVDKVIFKEINSLKYEDLRMNPNIINLTNKDHYKHL